MRAVSVDVSSASLVVTEVPDPVARPGQLLVRVHPAGLNRADLAVRSGTYRDRTGPATAQASRPFVAGSESAGEVIAVGTGVDGRSVGDRVMSLGQEYAELAPRLAH